MSANSQRRLDDAHTTQRRFLLLFLPSEREVFRRVAALVPNVINTKDIVRQTAFAPMVFFSGARMVVEAPSETRFAACQTNATHHEAM